MGTPAPESAAAVGVVLAAGSGSRLGTPKAVLELDGRRLVDRAVATLRAGGCADVVAVVREGVGVPDARVVVNHDPDEGMGGSLRLGLAAAGNARVAVLLLVVVPGVGADAVRALLHAHGAGARIAVATYAGRRGHPVLLERSLWAQAAALAVGDQGARGLLRAHAAAVVEVPCVGDPTDIDTPADLAGWRARG